MSAGTPGRLARFRADFPPKTKIQPNNPIPAMSLLEIIKSAISFFSGQKALLAAQAAEIKTLNDENAAGVAAITDLQAKLAADELDDAALQQAAKDAVAAQAAAEARAADLQAQLDALQPAGAELASLINEHEETPNIDPNTLAPVAPETPVEP